MTQQKGQRMSDTLHDQLRSEIQVVQGIKKWVMVIVGAVLLELMAAAGGLLWIGMIAQKVQENTAYRESSLTQT